MDKSETFEQIKGDRIFNDAVEFMQYQTMSNRKPSL